MTDPIWLRILTVIGDEIANMWWFFLLSILLVGVIKGYKLDLRIRDAMNRAGAFGVVLAVAIGLVSPLCACGILPVVVSLAMVGTPIAPIVALLVTSPTMSPDAFLLTWKGLGMEWALLKLAGSIFLGLFSGFVTLALVRRGWLSSTPVRLKPVYRADGTLASAYEIGQANAIPLKTMTIVPRASRLRFILDRTLDAGLFTGKFLLLAIVLEAIIVTVVPIGWITFLVGQKNFTSLIVAAGAGLPLPINQIPAIPVLAGLLERGMDKGAALTFFMAGPASSIPALIALLGMFERRVVYVFLATTLGGSIFLGWLYQTLF
jgi:hypothetical protein